ncbi:MAG: hypothetical protein FD123_365 [Bacteroidetes bacterium]|nr:MAG: hypothetical protein FD123_365 [Bacteroidota bacterium]
MFKERIKLYAELEKLRKSKLLVYVTGDRRGLETQLSQEVLPHFTEHLDKIGDTEKISLFLYTRGGNTIAAWSIVNLLRSFCKQLEIIVPLHCHSAGTLMCLGANNIIMTKQATLGPIDPSTNGMMNPLIEHNGQRVRVPVSVEVVSAYLGMAKEELKITDPRALADIYIALSEKIHPMSLGEVYRTRSQIQMLAKKLLTKQGVTEEDKQTPIINFLCSESGSHDYTIYRKEAKEELGLPIEKPDDNLYSIINSIYKSIETEMLLTVPLEPKILMAATNDLNYSYRRVIVESLVNGCHVYTTEGSYNKQPISIQGPGGAAIQNTSIQDNRTFEGWRHEILSEPKK